MSETGGHGTSDAPPFDVYLEEVPTTPVVVSVPHAGVLIDGFEADLSPELDPRCDADLYVDKLYQGLQPGSYVSARVSRFVCDLNRHPDDVNSRTVPQHRAPRGRNRRGFIWEITTRAEPVLRRPLSLDEWQRRKDIHDGYYTALDTALQRARNKFGFAVLIDGHSMPSTGRADHADPGVVRADMVPGDREGRTCARALRRLAMDSFQSAGYTTRANTPYKGGFITTHHGHPEAGVHAIQIELRRDLYMDEETYAVREPGFSRLRETLQQMLARVNEWRPQDA